MITKRVVTSQRSALGRGSAIGAFSLSWGFCQTVNEKDQTPQANLKVAPKLIENVLHPGKCDQSVTAAPTIIEPTSWAALR